MSDDLDYRRLLHDIERYYQTEWLPVDRQMHTWMITLGLGLVGLVLGFNNVFLRGGGVCMAAFSATMLFITTIKHNRRSRTLMAMHQQALAMLRERL